MKRIFITGPMSSSGEPGPNINKAGKAAQQLLLAGFAVYVPHVNWLIDIAFPTEPRFWWQNSLEWLRVSDGILRLPGPSKGAERETEFAEEKGIPVFFSVDDVIRYFMNREPDGDLV